MKASAYSRREMGGGNEMAVGMVYDDWINLWYEKSFPYSQVSYLRNVGVDLWSTYLTVLYHLQRIYSV
jgi:hypothetical protein